MKIFGSLAGVDQIEQFGSLAAGSPVYTTDPSVIQALSNYLEGWFGGVVGADLPAIEDLNALCFLFAYQLTYNMQAGIPEWDSATIYFKGSLCTDVAGGKVYVSLTDNNTGNLLTVQSAWCLAGQRQRLVTAATDTMLSSDEVVRLNPTAAPIVATLLDATTLPLGMLVTYKTVGASGNTVTINAFGGQFMDTLASVVLATLPSNDSLTLRNNGTGWDIV